MQKYHITYDVHPTPEGVFKADVVKVDNRGACDNLVIGSIVLPEDGSYSQMTYGYCGKEERFLTDEELFKFWIMLSAQLTDSGTLDDSRKGLCAITFETFTNALMQRRTSNETYQETDSN